MADNVTLNPMSGGAVVATDEVVDGTLGTVQVQYVKIMDGTPDGTTKGSIDATYGLKVDVARSAIAAVTQSAGPWTVIERGATIDSSSVSVTTSNTSVVAAATDRRSVTLQNLGTDYIYLGKTGVAVNTGIRLAPGQTFVLDRSPNAALFAIAASGTHTVSIFIEKD